MGTFAGTALPPVVRVDGSADAAFTIRAETAVPVKSVGQIRRWILPISLTTVVQSDAVVREIRAVKNTSRNKKAARRR